MPRYAKEGAIVLTGDIISKFLTFAISLILLRFVTPYEYSFFGAFITLIAMVNQFTDSGLNQSFIRFYAKYNDVQPEKARAYLSLVFRLKWIILPFAAILLYVIAPLLAVNFFHAEQLILPFRLLSIGLIGGGIFEFATSVLQAKQEFKKLSILRMVEASAKVLYIILVALLGIFSLLQVYLAYTTIPILIGGIAILFIGIHRENIEYDWKQIGRELFHFGKWIAVTSFSTMFLMKLDMLLVQFLIPQDKTAVGLYSAANRLCQPLVVVAGSVATLFYPKAMALRTVTEMKNFIRQTLSLSIPLSIAMSVYALLLYFILPSFAPEYTTAYPAFFILFIGYIFTILVNPITMLILTIGKPHIVAAISLTQLVITVIMHTVFILWLGSIGAAVSSVIIWLLAGTTSLWYLYLHKHHINIAG